MSERNGGGKVTDVTSFFGVFLFQKQRRLQKILNKEITNKTVRKQQKTLPTLMIWGVEA